MRSKSGIALMAAIVLAVGSAVLAWQAGTSAQRREQSGQEAVEAARSAAAAIFSYDHKGFDAAVANGKSFTTGTFAQEYAQTTTTLKQAALKEQAVVRAEVSAAGLVSVAEDKVEVLLYVNQYRSNLNIKGEKLDQNRVVLTMARTPDGWKVVQAAAI